MSEMRRKIMETLPESYAIKIPLYGPLTLLHSIYFPKADGEVDNPDGTAKIGTGVSIYFNPYKATLTNDGTSIAPKYPVEVTITFLKTGTEEVLCSKTIPWKQTVAQGRPYIGFAAFPMEEDDSAYGGLDINLSSYITDYQFGVTDVSKGVDMEVIVSSPIEVPLSCIVTPLETRCKKSSDTSSKNTDGEYSTYTSSNCNDLKNVQEDYIQLNRDITETENGLTTFGFNHRGIKYIDSFNWWGDE